MMCGTLQRLVLVAAATLLMGQSIVGVGSAGAAEPAPVAADLVELAIAIPDAVSRVKVLENERWKSNSKSLPSALCSPGRGVNGKIIPRRWTSARANCGSRCSNSC
jgi:hypothetical protein